MTLDRDRVRARLEVRGTVQGVGFRPYVACLARGLDLAGWVLNATGGVRVEVEGNAVQVAAFLRRLPVEAPMHAAIGDVHSVWCAPCGEREFTIRESLVERSAPMMPRILPDLATCPECVREIRDPANRRHRYPFTNCTQCGPRYSILEGWPYDRQRTSMRPFVLCARCAAEYSDPADRRYHAQPNACPECGPQVSLAAGRGRVMATCDDALRLAVQLLRGGGVLAVKGVGGFHLWTLAHDDAAVRRLRDAKQRPSKPMALMVPSLAQAHALAVLDDLEEKAMVSSAAPIVLARKRGHPPTGSGVWEPSPAVAPDLAWWGIMLPNSPLHHLLLGDLGCAVVATSGNRSSEPLCTSNEDAFDRLQGVADLFLVHNRDIVRGLDDSVVRVIAGRVTTLRHARGLAPTLIPWAGGTGRPWKEGEDEGGEAVLGVGGDGKGAVAVGSREAIVLGQHLGDLESHRACELHAQSLRDLPRLFQVTAERVACDGHPAYAGTRWARACGLPVRAIQHHVAHVLAAMAEHGLRDPVLGVAWDGTGDGMDGTVWGGEFLAVATHGVRRVGRLRPFRLPGGDGAVREPRRVALALLGEALGSAAWRQGADAFPHGFSGPELDLLERMLARGVNCPVTTSAGRLFDGAAALVGLRQRCDFEGQAAMALESAAASQEPVGDAYPVGVIWDETAGLWELDWRDLIRGVLADVERREAVPRMAMRFHESLADGLVALAARVGTPDVVLTGGCFQNARLSAGVRQRLRARGMRPYQPERVPANDGGLALGQVAAALWFGEEPVPCA